METAQSRTLELKEESKEAKGGSLEEFIEVHSIDADRCLFDRASNPTLENFIERSPQLFGFIKNKIRECKGHSHIICGSNRQSHALDKSNSSVDVSDSLGRKHTLTTPSIFKALEHLASCLSDDTYRDVFLSQFLLTDILKDRPAGTTWNGKDQDNDLYMDKNKIVLLYAQMHYYHSIYPNKKIIFNFYDDDDKILDNLHKVFSKNPQMIPQGIELRLHRCINYQGQQIIGLHTVSSDIPNKRVNAIIQGTNTAKEIDYGYHVKTLLDICQLERDGFKDTVLKIENQKLDKFLASSSKNPYNGIKQIESKHFCSKTDASIESSKEEVNFYDKFNSWLIQKNYPIDFQQRLENKAKYGLLKNTGIQVYTSDKKITCSSEIDAYETSNLIRRSIRYNSSYSLDENRARLQLLHEFKLEQIRNGSNDEKEWRKYFCSDGNEFFCDKLIRVILETKWEVGKGGDWVTATWDGKNSSSHLVPKNISNILKLIQFEKRKEKSVQNWSRVFSEICQIAENASKNPPWCIKRCSLFGGKRDAVTQSFYQLIASYKPEQQKPQKDSSLHA